MKKTLIALAVLAASGASFAQATITGVVEYGYKATSNGTGATAGGLGADKGRVFVGASEDLGGGMKVAATMGVNLRGSGEATTGRDTILSLSTPMVTFAGGRKDYGDMIDEDIATADGGNRDFAGFTVNMGAINFGLNVVEASTGVGYGIGGAGDTAVTGQRFNHLMAGYASGNLTAGLQHRIYDSYTGLAADANKTRTGVNVGYNFGFVAAGGTFQTVTQVTGTTNQGMLTLSAPLGATTLSALWVTTTRNDSGTAANDGTRNGYTLKAAYALSKRTVVNAGYDNFKASLADSQNSTGTWLTLSHSF
jgi:hypothetical protein